MKELGKRKLNQRNKDIILPCLNWSLVQCSYKDGSGTRFSHLEKS
jgi:hypothetical protein